MVNEENSHTINSHSEPNSRELDTGRKVNQTQAASASNYAHQMTEEVTNKADKVLCSVGKGMSNLGSKIKENAPNEGKVKTAVEALGNTMESSGNYLADHDVEDITKDITEAMRQHPLMSIGVGVGVGLLLGSIMSRKSA